MNNRSCFEPPRIDLRSREFFIPERSIDLVHRLNVQLEGLHSETISKDALVRYANSKGLSVSRKILPAGKPSMLYFYYGHGFIIIDDGCSYIGEWYLLAYEIGRDLLGTRHNINLPQLSDDPLFLNAPFCFAGADYFAQCVFLPHNTVCKWLILHNGDAEIVIEKMLDFALETLSKDSFSKATKSLVRKKMVNRLYIIKKYFLDKDFIGKNMPDGYQDYTKIV